MADGTLDIFEHASPDPDGITKRYRMILDVVYDKKHDALTEKFVEIVEGALKVLLETNWDNDGRMAPEVYGGRLFGMLLAIGECQGALAFFQAKKHMPRAQYYCLCRYPIVQKALDELSK